jgi:small basic protein (TIGR04137 family)
VEKAHEVEIQRHDYLASEKPSLSESASEGSDRTTQKEPTMSLDRSLRTSGGLTQHRSVLKRNERIEKLKATANFDPAKKPVLGLVKTSSRKMGA